jgi:hypothetical protein
MPPSTQVRSAVHESRDANTVRVKWQRREGHTESTGQIESELKDFVRKEVSIQLSEVVSGYSLKSTMDVRDIYTDLEQFSILKTAVDLLDEAVEYLARAQSFLREGDDIAADDEIQKFHAALPELFCCRDLGDGFGTIVNAANIAINNQEGAFLNSRQVELLHSAIAEIRKNPFIPFQNVVSFLVAFQNADLAIDPPGLSVFAEGVNDENLS